MSLLHYVNKFIHMKPLEKYFIQLGSYINKLYSIKILKRVIHYFNTHTTFNYNMQTRDTQRNAQFLSTSIFLQYRAYLLIIHTPSWNTGMYLQLLFYLSYLIYIPFLYRHTNVTEFQITSWSRRLFKGYVIILQSMLPHAAQKQQVSPRLLYNF